MRDYDKDWIKLADPAPTKAELALAEQFARKGTKAAFALAMYARPCGATDNQIRVALGGPQAVLRNRLVKAGKLAERREQVDGRTCYRVSLPAKGTAKTTTKPAGKRQAKPRGKGTG